jgi:hypothetical protein
MRIDGAQARPPRSGGHSLGDTSARQPPVRCLDPDEHAAIQRGARSSGPQILHNDVADINRKRKKVTTVPLAPYRDLAAAPVDVLQPQAGDLTRAQPHPGQQPQHRVVPQPGCTVLVAGGQQGLYLRWLQRARQRRPPIGDLGHRVIQHPGGQPLQVPIPQQRTQRGRDPLGSLRGHSPRLSDHERTDITRHGWPETHTVSVHTARDEPPHGIDIAMGHRDSQPSLPQKVAAIPLQQFLHQRRGPHTTLPLCHPQPLQVIQQRPQRLRCQIRRITNSPPHRQKRLHHRRGQRPRTQTRLSQPPAQMRGQPQLATR